MQKNYNDVVVYVRNGAVMNALVLASALVAVKFQPEPTEFQKSEGLFVPAETRMEEHLTLVYLDPAHAKESMGSTEMDRATVRVIGVAPLVEGEGKATGWKDVVVPPSGTGNSGIPPLDEHMKVVVADGHTVSVATYADGSRFTGVPPLPDLAPFSESGKVNEYEHPESREAKANVAAAEAAAIVAAGGEQQASGVEAVEPKPGEPSVADLDAVAAEAPAVG